jgi:hypothetical protein
MEEFSDEPARILVDPNNPMHIETPLIFSPLMSSRLGHDIYLKLEVRIQFNRLLHQVLAMLTILYSVVLTALPVI